MIPQAHRCAALSLLLAAAAILLLYHPDAATAPKPTPPTPPAAAGTTVAAPVVPELTPGTPWGEPEPRPSRPALIPTSRAVPIPDARPNPAPPRRAFATVEPGEHLADFARRVYGTADAADRLWQANRDSLPGPDAPLTPGTLLRTP
jgi:hypothetical protein